MVMTPGISQALPLGMAGDGTIRKAGKGYLRRKAATGDGRRRQWPAVRPGILPGREVAYALGSMSAAGVAMDPVRTAGHDSNCQDLWMGVAPTQR